jgi:5-formyltetrahydrofolate cyclo-ligase
MLTTLLGQRTRVGFDRLRAALRVTVDGERTRYGDRMDRSDEHPDTDSDPIDGDLLRNRKASARRRAREARSKIRIDHERYNETLARFLDANVPRGLYVVVYEAMGDEVDLEPLIAADGQPRLRYALTRTPSEGHTLTVHPWGEPQERHPYGYRQPRSDSRQVADVDIGAVLVPGLAFDAYGRRLGRGKGYFDRFLARLDPTCLRIGITGDYRSDEVPVDAHDIPMTHLAYTDRVVTVERAR